MNDTVFTSVAGKPDGAGVGFRFNGGRLRPNAARARTAVDAVACALESEPLRLDDDGEDVGADNDTCEAGCSSLTVGRLFCDLRLLVMMSPSSAGGVGGRSLSLR